MLKDVYWVLLETILLRFAEREWDIVLRSREDGSKAVLALNKIVSGNN